MLSDLMSQPIFKILLFHWACLSNQNWPFKKKSELEKSKKPDERVCGYLVIGGYSYKNSPKLINHLCLSLYAVYVLKNNFVNSGHLWENDHESLLVCLLIRHLSPLESHNTMYLSSWPDMGRISVWEFENLHRRPS